MKVKVDDSLLDEDGLPYLGGYCEEGNAIIGQIATNIPRGIGNSFAQER